MQWSCLQDVSSFLLKFTHPFTHNNTHTHTLIGKQTKLDPKYLLYRMRERQKWRTGEEDDGRCDEDGNEEKRGESSWSCFVVLWPKCLPWIISLCTTLQFFYINITFSLHFYSLCITVQYHHCVSLFLLSLCFLAVCMFVRMCLEWLFFLVCTAVRTAPKPKMHALS